MTTLTLVVAAVCLFALPALGLYPSGDYEYQRYRPYPYPTYPTGGYPAVQNYERYEYGPVTALRQRNGGQQGADGQGSQRGIGQSQGGRGQGARGGMGGRGGRGGQGGMGGQSGRGGMGGNGGRGGMGGQGGRRDDRPNPPDAVAFSGNRKTTQFFFQQGPVLFDDVITNIGGGYNSDYGVFTAFESGIYLVNYNVVSLRKGAKTAAVDLLRNKEVINSASGSGYSGETSNSAVLFLNRFDQLSVQGRAESAIYCGDGGNDAFCSFSVTLLKMGVFSDSKSARPVPGW